MRWERERNGGRQGSSSYRAVTGLQEDELLPAES